VRRPARLRRLTSAALFLGAALALASAPAEARAQVLVQMPSPRASAQEWGKLVERLSEPGGYFDTDNLISNESSYLHAVGALRALRGPGPSGAYVGVGPDQNFSYIAAVRPRVAFIVDIRRDNLLQHLLFKALFLRARTRAEYLALLTGRPAPDDADAWRERPIEEIVAYLDHASSDGAAARAAREAVREILPELGVPLSEKDLATIARFHDEFIANGLDLRFTTHGRAPRPYYPTLRQLVRENDLAGKRASYLASDYDFRFVRGMHQRDAIVPVVGDLGGPKALGAIADLLAERGEKLVALYTSNVEYYLLRQGSFGRYAESVRRFPAASSALVVRSYFGFGGMPAHPFAVPGYASVQTVHRVADFLAEYDAGALRTYDDVVTRRALDPRTGK